MNESVSFGFGPVLAIQRFSATGLQAFQGLTLRGGTSHNSTFIKGEDVLLNVLTPATPTWHASVGASRKINDHATITGSYPRAFGKAKSGANLTPGFGQPLSMEMTQDELSLGMS